MRPGAALWLEPGAERVVRTRAEANKGIRRRQGGERTDELQLPEQIVHKDSMDSLTSCLLPDRSPFSLHRWRPGAPKKLPPGGPPCLSNILQTAIFILQWNNHAGTPPPPTVPVSLVGFPFRRIPGNRGWQRWGFPAPENCLHQYTAFRAGERISLQQVPLQTPKGRNCSTAGFD